MPCGNPNLIDMSFTKGKFERLGATTSGITDLRNLLKKFFRLDSSYKRNIRNVLKGLQESKLLILLLEYVESLILRQTTGQQAQKIMDDVANIYNSCLAFISNHFEEQLIEIKIA